MRIVSQEFNNLVERIANRIPHTYTTDQYADFASLQADYVLTGNIRINTEFSDNTIFGKPSINWKFRAWHDYCHLQTGGDFSRQGEVLAMRIQQRMIDVEPGYSQDQRNEFKRLIYIEVVGQLDYFEENNGFPVNQYETFNSIRSRYSDAEILGARCTGF